MATISLAGKVVGKNGESAVSLKEGKDYTIASFSIKDSSYCYFKNKDDNPGQFYRCEVIGKQASIAAQRLERGHRVAVTGQTVWREYNGTKYLDVKNCQVTFLEDPVQTKGADDLF
ncbi:MAG: single-stranded DNA-binding protein [Candidatus Nanopelagicaceae bacterium]